MPDNKTHLKVYNIISPHLSLPRVYKQNTNLDYDILFGETSHQDSSFADDKTR